MSSRLGAYTWIVTADPPILGKVVHSDGASETIMNYSSAGFVVGTVASLIDFASYFQAMEAGHHYLIYGVPLDGAEGGRITTNGRAGKGGALPKTLEHFGFARGIPGILCCDIDPPTDKSFDAAGARAAFLDAVPGLAQHSSVWLPSSSSFIYRGDEEVRGLQGSRLYWGVADASDIPRAGDVLFKRLWISGSGWLKISEAGEPLERTLYDKAMRSPVQPDFCAGAYCEPPFLQRRGAPVVAEGIDWIDTRATLPELTVVEEERYQGLVREARLKAEPECAAQRDAYRTRRRRDVARYHLGPAGADADIETLVTEMEERGEFRALDQLIDGRRDTLPLDWPVELKDGQTISVATILRSGGKYHCAICRDPKRPEYLSRRIHTDGVPNIYSCASGGVTYLLGTPEERAELSAELQAAQRIIAALAAAPARVRRDFIRKVLEDNRA